MKVKDFLFALGGFGLLFLSGSALVFFLTFGTALNQEKDTPEVLKAAMRMELSRSNAVRISSSQQRLLVRDSGLTTYLEQRGWTLADRLGAMFVFRQGKQKLMANCGMFSRNYMICDLDRVP